MEDEDGESKVMDMWSILGKQQLKDNSIGNSLKPSIDNAYTDVIEEEKQLLRYNSVATKDSPSKNNSTGSKIVFKGFKKRILAQAQEIQTNTAKIIAQEQQSLHSNVSPKSSKEKKAEIKRGKITEYAQYLGLQPSTKNKCTKCNSSSNLCSTLKQSSCTCNSAMTPMPSTSESSTMPPSPNFKITRKVYLCAACGTYFENWNLFLHMRDIHKRHICLFCLGMFGQAERLSYHLTKKHSVPEMAFTSVEDFYGAFKGSCYLVCCSCEKVFSETDNFYNHFCSPTSKQEVTASICTLCRQTGTHASTCSLAVDTSKEVNSVLPVSPQASVIPTHVLDKAVSGGNKTVSRKLIKNHRSKHIEDSVSNQQKVNTHTKKTNNKIAASRPNESQLSDETLSRDENSENEVTHNAIKDTVSETIMEVSKYTENSCEAREETNENAVCPKNSELQPSIDGNSHNMPYDSVTETIMEVSRCTNNVEDSNTIKKEITGSVDTLDVSEKTEVDSDKISKQNTETPSSNEKTDITVNESNLINDEAEDVHKDETLETEMETKSDSPSRVSESSAHSPVNRSLFSPQHELQVSDLQSKEDTSENENKENLDVPNESQSSVSFNAAETSDRSLVIKICTNKNSQFTVTTKSESIENDDVNEKSEENNNADSSVAEEKESSVSEKDNKENNASFQTHDGDSDSDSFKLAVVDSNSEGTEEVEEAKEGKIVAEDKVESDMNIGSDENQIEITEEKSIDINENGNDDIEEQEKDVNQNEAENSVELQTQPNDGIMLAGEDVPCIDLNVDGILDSIEIDDLLKRCIEAASPFCVYCNHARHIAVNGKQLGLHMLAEHKFQPQHPAIIIQAEQFVARVKKSLDELDSHFFNLDSYSSENGTYNVPSVRTYECFHCRFHSAIHKELYLHNRKMHQKTILICIMCKSTFYSYSELLCHLCPGTYSPNINVKYRCCLCPVSNLPSAFRLMVHLRKRHHACDVCLESTGNQQRLSNHVWKHKLHHLCYRCGIAYRNKPDITKHLFWKHGTESVLCKKCLQKKWPHIYHFCIPPTAFVCEECGSSFSRAVALKVHKRLHSGDQPYACSECSERFISRKLLTKHENAHKEPPPVSASLADTTSQPPMLDEEKSDKEKTVVADSNSAASECTKEAKEPVKKVVDVYDLPPLNLSSESDTDSEEEKVETKEPEAIEKSKPIEEDSKEPPMDQQNAVSSEPVADSIVEVEQNEEEKEQGAQIMDGIWDNFKSYTASLEMKDSGNNFIKEPEQEPEPETDVAFLRSIVLADHDYCVVWSDKEKEKQPEAKLNEKEEVTPSGDQDYLNKAQKNPAENNGMQSVSEEDPNKKKAKSPKKKKQNGSTSSSDSSSDSDSSSCSCGTNCSCSSSSSGSSSSSSSSSDSDSSTSENSPKKRKERKKDKDGAQESEAGRLDQENKEASAEMENGGGAVAEPVCLPQLLLRESDLETEETETDEDFYDEHPQQLANKLLAEKRNQLLLLAAVAPASTESAMPLNNGLTDVDTAIPSPDQMSTATEDQSQQKRKVKTKKRKKGERTKQRNVAPPVESIKLNIPKAFYQKNPSYPASSPTLMQHTMPLGSTNDAHLANASVESQAVGMTSQNIGGSGSEPENKRSSKRKRVPKRFYGDSSDDEVEKQPVTKWRKAETPTFAITPSIKTLPARLSFGGKSVAYRPPIQESQPENLGLATASATDSEEPAESSSESSDSEVEASQQMQTHLAESNTTVAERPVNLYCYCQCPYDEVSEMIACDAEDCRIEWFHFECVGIMVPPKGKWYCPDCRKKHGIVQNSEDYFD